MLNPASSSEVIDLALDLFDWHRRYVLARAFLRAMPCIFSQPRLASDHEGTITPRHVLNIYRSGLLLCVAAKFGPIDAKITSLERLRLPAEGARYDISISAKNAARSAIVSIEHSVERTSELCLADAFDAVAKFERENPDKQELFAEANELLLGETQGSADPSSLDFSEALWPKLSNRPMMDRTYSTGEVPKFGSTEHAGGDFLNSSFWRDWYWGMVAGQPIDWELQRRVALINDEIWRNGPEAVTSEIEATRARWQVETALADFRKSFGLQQTTRHGIGGNNPPESIQDQGLSGAITLIWEAKEELSEALEQENPKREWVEKILEKLRAGCLALTKWIGRKADLAVDTAIETAIKQGGLLVGGYYALDKLIKAVEEWLPFLP